MMIHQDESSRPPFCHGSHCICPTFLPWLPLHVSMTRPSTWDNVTARRQHTKSEVTIPNGALQNNIDEAVALGAKVLHSIDATNLQGTLLPFCAQTYHCIVFPFPRASLQRGVIPKNPRLLRQFFRSVNRAGVLESLPLMPWLSTTIPFWLKPIAKPVGIATLVASVCCPASRIDRHPAFTQASCENGFPRRGDPADKKSSYV